MPGSDPFAPDPSALPDGGTGTILEDRPEIRESEPGDHERFSHYVRKEKIMESAVTGTAVVALCGKVWVPSRDPQRFPVCPECKEIYESLPAGGGGGGEGSGDGGAS
jgi:hypothetical protein